MSVCSLYVVRDSSAGRRHYYFFARAGSGPTALAKKKCRWTAEESRTSLYVVFPLGKILLLDRCFHPSPNISSSNIIIYTFFILLLPVWTQKCAVQKASVDVNISYYPAMTAFADQYSLPNILF